MCKMNMWHSPSFFGDLTMYKDHQSCSLNKFDDTWAWTFMCGPNEVLGGKSNLLKFFGVYVNSIIMCHRCKALIETFFLHVEGQHISQGSLSHINLEYLMLLLESNHLETKISSYRIAGCIFTFPMLYLNIASLKMLEASFSSDIDFLKFVQFLWNKHQKYRLSIARKRLGWINHKHVGDVFFLLDSLTWPPQVPSIK